MSRFLRFFRIFAFVIACAFSAFSAQAYTITLDDQGAIDHSGPQYFDSSNYQGLSSLYQYNSVQSSVQHNHTQVYTEQQNFEDCQIQMTTY